MLRCKGLLRRATNECSTCERVVIEQEFRVMRCNPSQVLKPNKLVQRIHIQLFSGILSTVEPVRVCQTRPTVSIAV
jgi:hypothetical protein